MRKKSGRKIKKITYKMQANLLLVFCAIVILMVTLIGIIIKINVKDGNKYAKRVLSQQSYTSSEIPYKRGDIQDCNGVILATSVKVYNLAIDPKFILTQSNGEYLYKDTVVEILTRYFDIEESELLKILEEKKNAQYYILKSKLSGEIVDGYNDYIEKYQEDNNAIIKGVWFEEEYQRKYPLSTVASSVLGFMYDKNAGSWGIEEKYNNVLNGSTGRTYGYYDSELNLERVVKEAVNGNTIVSCIDSNIQQIVEKHINEFNKEIGCENVSVIIANPKNGNIISMASSKGIYDLNNPRDLSGIYTDEEIAGMTINEKSEALNNIWRNYCISDTYEPGSTFKPFVVAAGLEESILKGNEIFLCDGKETVVEGVNPIRCAKREGHGYITLKEALMYSCNDALMSIGKSLGRDLFAKYQSHFYFGNRTGIDLKGEATGIVYNKEGLNSLELATSSFGQGLNVTMIQMVAGFSSLVNGGNYYEPRVVEKIVNDSGVTVDSLEPVLVKKTVSDKTSDFLRDALKATVEEGTASSAAVEGYSVGGKTGTAQKLPRAEKNYLVSFIGMAPCEDPSMVIYVIVDQPHVDVQSNSVYAQELAADIMKEVFPFLGIFPESEETDYKKTDETTNEEDETKKSTFTFTSEADYNYQFIDNDTVATSTDIPREIGTETDVIDSLNEDNTNKETKKTDKSNKIGKTEEKKDSGDNEASDEY